MNRNPETRTNNGDDKQMAEEVREKAASAAAEATEKAKVQARSTIAAQKEEAVNSLHGVAEALRKTSSQLHEQDQTMVARYSDKAAEQVDRMSELLYEKNLDEILHEAQKFARRKPEIFLGGAFTLGLMATRFFKSSAPSHSGGSVEYLPARYSAPSRWENTDENGRLRDRPQRVNYRSWEERNR